MGQKFQATVQRRDNIGVIKLSGVIDEDNELNDLAVNLPAGTTIVLDSGEVVRINSCGVRDWVQWIQSLEARNFQLVFVECSPAVVAQINLVSNFIGRGTVQSFHVPYFCPECDEEKVLLSETSDLDPPYDPPVCRCDECDLVMDFDDMADSYFAFVRNQKKSSMPEKLKRALSDVSSDSARIRRRAGTNSLTGSVSSSSLPMVPALPSITATGMGTGLGSGAGSMPGSHSGLLSHELLYKEAPPAPAPRSKAMWALYAGVGVVLLLLLAVLSQVIL